MFIVSEIEVVAWSDKGDAVLVHTSSGGPEGGGSFEYAVFGPKYVVQAHLSNTMSPGDGSTPEHITPGDCRMAAKALADAVAAAAFTGVEVHPERCGGERWDVVKVPPPPASGSGDVAVVLRDDHAVVKTAAGELKIELAKHVDADVWRAPNGPLLVIRIRGETGSSIDAFVMVPADAAPSQVRFGSPGPVPGL